MKTGLYKHYKGGYYQLIGVGAHTETEELMVVYVSLDASRSGPRLRVRPLDGPEGWNTKTADGLERFTWIGDQL